MRVSIKIIACFYVLLGAVAVAQWVYAVLYIGTWNTSDLLVGIVPLGLGHGLVTLRRCAETVGIVFAVLLAGVGVVSLMLWVMSIMGYLQGGSGLIVDRPFAALIIIALMIAFGAWQWWVLTRPQANHLFSSKPA